MSTKRIGNEMFICLIIDYKETYITSISNNTCIVCIIHISIVCRLQSSSSMCLSGN